MNTSRTHFTWTLALSLAGISQGFQAQEIEPAGLSAADLWRTPIHTQAADPDGGDYGLWASGATYKASFDDGFTFYPVLGERYPRNLPLRWRTTRIAAGKNDLVTSDSKARATYTDWRYELEYQGVTEAYDVLEDGVEQTFRFHAAPRTPGDLVVEGEFTTELLATAFEAAHAPIVFTDAEGVEILRYGKAFAYDAAGRFTELRTTFDGRSVRIRIEAEWLAEATWPVTLDPLTSRSSIPPNTGSGNDPASYPNIARDDTNNRLLVVYSRPVSATDYDVWARLHTDQFTHLGSIFTDITASWSTRHTSVCWVGGAGRWAVALGRDFDSTNRSRVRVYVHETSNTTLNSGQVLIKATPTGFSDQTPSIGGQTSLALDGRAYLVFRRDMGGVRAQTQDSRVYGTLVDTLSGTFSSEQNLQNLSGVSDYDAEFASISQDAGRTGSWMVVWHMFNRGNQGDDWDAIGARVTRIGAITSNATFGPSGTSGRHKLYPQVAGNGGRYLVSYLMRDNTSAASSTTGNQFEVERFDWAEGAASPTRLGRTTISESPSNTLRANLTNRAMAFDHNTDSHWAFTYRTTPNDIIVVRCGHQGGVVERAIVFNDPIIAGISPTVCYNDDDYEFPLVYATNEAPGDPLYGVRFQYFNAAGVQYGSGCHGRIEATNRGPRDLPYAGSEFFSIGLTNGHPGTPTLLVLSSGPAHFPIGNGCFLSLDPNVLVTMGSGLSDGTGAFSVPVALLDAYPSVDLYWQAFQVRGRQVFSTRGLRTEIR